MIHWQTYSTLAINGFHVNTPAILMIFAFLVVLFCFFLGAKKEGIAKQHILNISAISFFSGIFGAHLVHIIFHPEYISHQESFLEILIEIFAFWRGGLASYGAIIFPFFFVLAYIWQKKELSLWKIADIIAPFIALGFAIQRVGCFLYGCCFGRPTDLPWGIVYNQGSPAALVFGDTPLHPTQIYLLLGNLLIFLILLKLDKVRKTTGFINFKGSLFLSFLVLYSLERFFIHFLRYSPPNELCFGFLNRGQIFCAFIFFIAIYFLVKKSFQNKKNISLSTK